MKRRMTIMTLIAGMVSICILLSSCGFLVREKDIGGLKTKDFNLVDFTAVEVGNAFNVEIEQSSTYSVRVTASDFDNVVVEKSGEKLRIGLKGFGMIFGSLHYEVRITMPELNELKLTGSTRGTATGFNSTSNLKVDVTGASDLDLEAETGSFSGEASGSSRLKASVKSTAATIKLSGASDATLELVTGDFEFNASGSSSGKGNVQTTDTKLILTGASDVELAGVGGNLNMNGSGSSVFSLLDYEIGNVQVNLSGASDATLKTNGTINGSLTGYSVLSYSGNPELGDNFDISSGSVFERQK
jgi:hypothetical protein